MTKNTKKRVKQWKIVHFRVQKPKSCAISGKICATARSHRCTFYKLWVSGGALGAEHVSTRVSKSCDRATVRLRNFFQRLRKIWVFDRKNVQFIFFNLFGVLFVFFFYVLDHFVCAKLLGRNFGRAKKFAFRKSATQARGGAH